MTIPRGYVADHKFWDRMGRITPNVEWSESHRPHFESQVAGWLPVSREEKEYEWYITVSSGKVVGLTREGDVCPAGLRKAWNVAGATTILTYTATDVAEGVEDLTTGAAVAAATSYTETQVTTALRERGLIRHTERAMAFISKPVGFAAYNFYNRAGTDHYNPANLKKHNFRPQALVAIVCDYVSTFPVLPAVATTETMANDNTGGAATALENFFNGTTTPRVAGWFNATQINAVTRYASNVAATDNVVGYMMVNYPVAHTTEDSTIVASVAGLTREVGDITKLNAAGDFFLDYEVGMLFLYEAGGDAIPSPWSTAATLTYYHYNAVGVNVSTYACATGNLEYGDFLTYDDNSNLIKAELDIANAEGFDAAGAVYSADPDYGAGDDDDISLQLEQAIDNHVFGVVGQVLGTVTFGEGRHSRSNLDRVHTAFMGQTAANLQTPGTATGGRTDQLTYANAAERMLIVNLILR
jgi:hypothetical protein